MFSPKFKINIKEIKSSIYDGLKATIVIMGVTYQALIEQITNIFKTAFSINSFSFLLPYLYVFVFVFLLQAFFKWLRPGEVINSKMRIEMLDLPKIDPTDHISE
jgi:hypothetical protein